ncbi:hypothetical protein [Asticcacaulis taihuensis]|uniref:hypothetical protein n=1 Tax=Asticcacaulis taihuensis TaxID=260084 RepID=UPI0026F116D6|nr:hypothetical protein [Asticcacaulis taihuensis]
MTDRPAHQFQPRPRLISPADFAELADLAWRTDPRRGLAKQISMGTGISESTIDRWLKDDDGYPPPVDIVQKAFALADKRLAEKADLLDRISQALK